MILGIGVFKRDYVRYNLRTMIINRYAKHFVGVLVLEKFAEQVSASIMKTAYRERDTVLTKRLGGKFILLQGLRCD